jgi:predicted MFS family arabinose efflux permease
MLSQLGYCLGLVLIAPLGDLVENRRLVLVTLGGLCLAVVGAASAPHVAVLLIAALCIGIGSTAVQMLIPLAVHMTDHASRGQVVGRITGGLLAGIMLARPLASIVTAWLGWRGLYAADAVVLLLLTVLLSRYLPTRRPEPKLRYSELIGSLYQLFRAHPTLRTLAGAQAYLFGAFSLFWGCAPVVLMHRFGMSQNGVALFALAGAAGALSAPIVGFAADRGFAKEVRFAGATAVAGGFVLAITLDSVTGWVLAALMIDAGVQACHVVAQRTILMLEPAARSRLNSIYIAIFFFGGAIGSALVSPLLVYSWRGAAATGIVAALVAAALLVKQSCSNRPSPLVEQ